MPKSETPAVIPAQPYEYSLPEKSHIALIIVDMQRDFLEPGGFGEILGNDVSKLQAIVPNVKRLQSVFREQGITIIQTKEGHKGDLSDCPPSKRSRGKGALTIGDEGPMGRILVLGEPGNDIIEAVKPEPKEIVINKPGKGAFYNTELDTLLQERQITHLIFTGVTTEVCVQSTMREANDRGYECLLVEDATESYFPEFKQATLEMVRAQGGIVGWTATTQQVLDSLSHSKGLLNNGIERFNH
ncbi:MAG: isochorismatase family cysteine hydrolase [Cyanobacteria bacterium P01_A01_bin.116]